MMAGVGENPMPMIEFVGSKSGSSEAGIVKEEGDQQDWKRLENTTHLPEYKEGMENSLSFTSGVHDMSMSMEGTWTPESLRTSTGGHVHFGNLMGEEGFTTLLLNNSDDRSLSDGGDDSDNGGGSGSGSGSGSDCYEDNKNYWNSILHLVNSPPTDSPMF
jgi:myb proto-oncogene protein